MRFADDPRPAREPRVAQGADSGINLNDETQVATAIAVVAGLIVGVLFAKLTEEASVSSQDRGTVSESLMSELSASAGMEDVEDGAADNKRTDMVNAMRKAQGLEE